MLLWAILSLIQIKCFGISRQNWTILYLYFMSLSILITFCCRRNILLRMVSHSELRKVFCSADAVCFDVDSTVIREEGIDELAKICGVEDAVSEM